MNTIEREKESHHRFHSIEMKKKQRTLCHSSVVYLSKPTNELISCIAGNPSTHFFFNQFFFHSFFVVLVFIASTPSEKVFWPWFYFSFMHFFSVISSFRQRSHQSTNLTVHVISLTNHLLPIWSVVFLDWRTKQLKNCLKMTMSERNDFCLVCVWDS